MEREEISILVSGGCICFFGDWFGRPYDNFHEIKSAEYKDNTLTIEFSGGEKLIVSSPENIKNEKKELYIQKASKVEWIYTPYGGEYRDERKYVYTVEDGKVIKTTKYGNQILSLKKSYAAVFIG